MLFAAGNITDITASGVNIIFFLSSRHLKQCRRYCTILILLFTITLCTREKAARDVPGRVFFYVNPNGRTKRRKRAGGFVVVSPVLCVPPTLPPLICKFYFADCVYVCLIYPLLPYFLSGRLSERRRPTSECGKKENTVKRSWRKET